MAQQHPRSRCRFWSVRNTGCNTWRLALTYCSGDGHTPSVVAFRVIWSITLADKNTSAVFERTEIKLPALSRLRLQYGSTSYGRRCG